MALDYRPTRSLLFERLQALFAAHFWTISRQEQDHAADTVRLRVTRGDLSGTRREDFTVPLYMSVVEAVDLVHVQMKLRGMT